MKKNFLLLIFMWILFYSFGFALCWFEFKPVCWIKRWVCVWNSCSKLYWTYSNMCFLQQDNAQFLHTWYCTDNELSFENDKNNDFSKSSLQENLSKKTDESFSWTTNLTQESQQEILKLLTKIKEKLAWKSLDYQQKYIRNFISQIKNLSSKLKSQEQINKYQKLIKILTDKYLVNTYKSKEESNFQTWYSKNVGSDKKLEGKTNDLKNNSLFKNTKVYNFSSLWFQIITNKNTIYKVSWNEMVFENGNTFFVIKLLDTPQTQQNSNKQNVDKTSSIDSNTLPIMSLSWKKILEQWNNLNQVISRYIRDNLCTQKYWWKRLASYQIIKKIKNYQNVADYEMIYLCQEYVKQWNKYIAKTTYSSPLKLSLLWKDWIYYLIKSQKPQDWPNYSEDVKKIFFQPNWKLFLWEDIQRYNQIVDELSKQNENRINNN